MIWLVAAAAFAQEGPQVPNLNAQNYRPPMDAERTLWADDAGQIYDDTGIFKARGFLHYVHRPLVFIPRDDTQDTTSIVTNVLQLDALAMYHYDRFRVGIHVPVYLYSAGQLTDNGAGLGDIALDGRVTIFDRDDEVIGLAAGTRLTLPTTSVQAPLGWSSVGGEIFAIADYEVDDQVLLVANLGGRFVPKEELNNVRLNDQIFARIGAGWQLVDDAGVSLDLNSNFNLAEFGNVAGLPIEALVGGWYRFKDDFVVRGGLGTGLTPGIGSGNFRGIVSFGYEPKEDLDPDMDGLFGDEDSCPMDPEDKDDFEDLDGCPDLDNDKDGILDGEDKCPLDPEDQDGYQDDDGCPDPSSQVTVKLIKQNGEPVPQGKGLITAEGVEEKGGSEFVADLHEGQYTLKGEAPEYIPKEMSFKMPMPDGKDEIVMVLQPDVIMGDLKLKVVDSAKVPQEDVIWYLDGGVGPKPMLAGEVQVNIPAGKHSLDIRKEGFVSDRREIQVPEQKLLELTIVLKPSKVKVTKEKVEVNGTVYFDTAKATIQTRSFPLLDDVAGVLIDNPQLTKIRIEGHTDSRGGADYNRKLSDDRAASVKQYLINKGVDAKRLESIGYGEDRPVDDRNVAEAWEKNRRVDFFIVERADEEE